MSAILPINVDDLVRGRAIESARIEFKASWSPDTTGFQVLKTICAFANDYQSLNGGCVVLGVAESEGRAALPPAGMSSAEVDAAQRWIRGHCTAMRPGGVLVFLDGVGLRRGCVLLALPVHSGLNLQSRL